MDQIKKEMDLAQQDTEERGIENTLRDVQALNDQQLVLVGGGECISCW
jgi:hypothetical protein